MMPIRSLRLSRRLVVAAAVTMTTAGFVVLLPSAGATAHGKAAAPAWQRVLSAPGNRNNTTMNLIYDEARQQLLMFGEEPANDGWRWTGSTWVPLSGTMPPPRSDAAMAYDAATKQIVMFGGSQGGSNPLGDTWIWNGKSWSQYTGPGPSARYYALMAYDAASKQIVLFGGRGNASTGPLGANAADGASVSYLADTWIWNGSSWTQAAGTMPPGRQGGEAGMVYDAAQQKLVLFGGTNNTTPDYLGDTWTWNGTAWTQAASTGPSPRNVNVFLYDPASRQVLLYGGNGVTGDGVAGTEVQRPTGGLKDTWIWDGGQGGGHWSEAAGTSPSSAGSVAYDPATGRIVMFGGWSKNGPASDMWTWDGGRWTGPTVAKNGPSPRIAANIAYDARSESLILYGGQNSAGQLGDTWTYHGGSWRSVGALMPPTRSQASFVYDPDTGQTLMVGGDNVEGTTQDTWIWDGRQWSVNQQLEQVQGLLPASLIYDEARHKLLLVGNHTWAWTGQKWNPISASAPPQRGGGAMLYDDAHQQIVVYGGYPATGSGYLTDTWIWNGSSWHQAATTGPSGRSAAGLVYDAARKQVVLFGGLSNGLAQSDTWIWNGSAWKPASPATSPPARSSQTMFYDPTSKKVVVFSGTATNPYPDNNYLGDTWTWDGATWTQVTGTTPAARISASITYNPGTKHVLMFGGSGVTADGLAGTGLQQQTGLLGDSWEWTGQGWTRGPSDGPSPRTGAAVTYDQRHQRLLFFGGVGIVAGTYSWYLNDLWSLG